MPRHRHPDDVGPILYAIASLGGAEAEAFLFTLESGAPDEETRRAARGAYEDLIRRKKEDAARVSQRRRVPPGEGPPFSDCCSAPARQGRRHLPGQDQARMPPRTTRSPSATPGRTRSAVPT